MDRRGKNSLRKRGRFLALFLFFVYFQEVVSHETIFFPCFM